MTTPRLDDVNWARSSFCSTNGCVEVAWVGDVIRVRDGKSRDESPTIDYTPDQWVLFLARIVEEGMAHEAFLRLDDGGVDLVHSKPEGSTVLVFDREEWDSFVEGVEKGQFDLRKLSAQVPARAVADGAVSGYPGPDAASVAEGSRPGTPSATLDSPAGQQSADTSSGCADADRPGPEPVHGALVQLCRPDWTPTPTLGDPTGGVEDWAHEWATDSFAAGMALAEKIAESRAAALVNEANEWAKAIAPLVEHVPNESSPTATSEEGAVQTGCGTGGGGEVAPATVGVSAGATEPADECDGADR